MYLSKRATTISIEPWDSAVNTAMQKVNQLDASLLINVKKIIVHSGGGSGQLGHVASGPGKDPQEIHIFKDRVREHVMRNANATAKKTLTNQELQDAIISGLMETISHESGHIGKVTKTPEQIAKNPFAGEPEAEQTAKNLMQKVKSEKSFPLSKKADIIKSEKINSLITNAYIKLEEIKEKFQVNNEIEPDLKFAIYVNNNDKINSLKYGLTILKQAKNNSIINEVKKLKLTDIEEMKELLQDAGIEDKDLMSAINQTPDDVPYQSSSQFGKGYTDYITSQVPCSMTIPISSYAYDVRVHCEVEEDEEDEDKEKEKDDLEPMVNINGIEETGIESNMMQGLSLEPFFSNIGDLG